MSINILSSWQYSPFMNEVSLTYPNSPSPAMEKGLGGEVGG